jgi:putative transcriptional regulator
MRFDWDPTKAAKNVGQHRPTFEEAKEVFAPGVVVMERMVIRNNEVRWLRVGPIARGDIIVVVWTKAPRRHHPHHQCPICEARRTRVVPGVREENPVKKKLKKASPVPHPEPAEPLDPPELTREDFEAMLRSDQRARIIAGNLKPGDVAALRRFVQLTQTQFAQALGISVRTLQNWEQDRTTPDGPGLALLRIAARDPGAIRKNLADVA